MGTKDCMLAVDYINFNMLIAYRVFANRLLLFLAFTSLYLESLMEEKKTLAFHIHGLPICHNLLNQEITRVAAINQGHSDGNSSRNPLQHQGFGGPQGPPVDDENTIAASRCTLLTKKFLLLEVPVDSYPNYNFVGRLLGPGGNSLKRIEALTGCRVFIKGRGSMKDRNKEECLRGRPGHEHLNDPLHVLIKAEAPVHEVDAQLNHAQEIISSLLKPVVKSRDIYKRQQFRELAMLNSHIKGSISDKGTK